MGIERLTERDCLHHSGVLRRTSIEWIDFLLDTFLVGVNEEIESVFLRYRISEGDHLLELPCGVDVQEREWDRRRIESLPRQVEEYGGILADRIEHDRFAEGCSGLSKDLYRLVFEFPQYRSRATHGGILGNQPEKAVL